MPLHGTPSGNRGRGQLGVPRFRPSPPPVRPQPSGCALASFSGWSEPTLSVPDKLDSVPGIAVVPIVSVEHLDADPRVLQILMPEKISQGGV